MARKMSSDLLLAVAASLAIVLGSPFIGELRGAIQNALPGQYRLVLGAIVAVAVAGAIGAALRRIRERRQTRYAYLGASVLLGVTYAWATATGVADRDAVERFHLVEYGSLTFLYHRAWRAQGGVAALVLPVVAVMLTGLADEWVQWFVPSRVGELHDVLINGAAIACGLLFSLGVDPHPPLRSPLGPPPRLARALAMLVVGTTAFIHCVHLGFEIDDAATGTFRSRWSLAALDEARDQHTRRWNGVLPADAPLLSREDQYLAEALWHVRRRNEVAAANDWARAALENRIVERFFTPVLGAPGMRWPSGQQADIETRAAALPPVRASDADAIPVYLIDWRTLWAAALVVIGAMLWWERLKRPRGSGSTSSTAISIT
jgi:hypothetical protein